jgi:adenine-specific DNA-methyltransferase
VSTQSRDVKDGKREDLSREPEQIKAFRDTWKDGIHSYLTYLRDRLSVARELLTESGSIFVQIGDENVHRVRAVMDEVFGADNFVSQVTFRKGMTLASSHIANNSDFIIWFAKRRDNAKIRSVFEGRDWETDGSYSNGDPAEHLPAVSSGDATKSTSAATAFSTQPMHAAGVNRSCMFPVSFLGRTLPPPAQGWKTNEVGLRRAICAGRLIESGRTVRYKVYFRDYPVQAISNNWANIGSEPDKSYVVQTAQKVVQRKHGAQSCPLH